jgi:colanic acid biosynthesis protein WcaH
MVLDIATFKIIIENTPLVSIDLCLICGGQILLGRRNNEPLKGVWFTPGGRVLKNETWQDCLLRVSKTELGLEPDDLYQFRLMGVWDHFYKNSAVSESVSTHYVNLPHFVCFKQKPSFWMDEQHDEMQWFALQEVASSKNFHDHMQSYASWLITWGNNHD